MDLFFFYILNKSVPFLPFLSCFCYVATFCVLNVLPKNIKLLPEIIKPYDCIIQTIKIFSILHHQILHISGFGNCWVLHWFKIFCYRHIQNQTQLSNWKNINMSCEYTCLIFHSLLMVRTRKGTNMKYLSIHHGFHSARKHHLNFERLNIFNSKSFSRS